MNALMRTRTIEGPDILNEDTAEVRLAHEQNVIEAFPTNTAQQSFADRIRPCCPERRPEDLDPAPGCNGIKVRAILRIVVTNQIVRPGAERCCLPQLLSNPPITRPACHTD